MGLPSGSLACQCLSSVRVRSHGANNGPVAVPVRDQYLAVAREPTGYLLVLASCKCIRITIALNRRATGKIPRTRMKRLFALSRGDYAHTHDGTLPDCRVGSA